MVTAEKAENHVMESLIRALSSMGFVRVSAYMIEHVRPGGIAWQLRCGVRVDSVSKQAMVGLSAGLRIQAIENFLERKQELDAQTLTVPIHFLHGDRRLVEWDAFDRDTARVLVAEVKEFALPFFTRYECLENLLSSLESDDPQKWICVSSKERVELLVAVLAVIGRKDDAVLIVDRELNALRNKPPGHRRGLERLRTKLLE